MAKPDGRVEAGQSLKRAISAQRWNDLCDAADIVHGRRPGVKAVGPNKPALRQVLTCLKKNPNDLILPGHAIVTSTGLQQSSDYAATIATDQAPQSPEWFDQLLKGTTGPTGTTNASLRTAIAAAAGTRSNPLLFTVTKYTSTLSAAADSAPPLGFATQLSEPGSKTVRVCVSGTALALARIFESQTEQAVTQANGLTTRTLSTTMLVRGRRVFKEGTQQGEQIVPPYTYYDQEDGVMDVGAGGSVIVLTKRIIAPDAFPVYAWLWVMI